MPVASRSIGTIGRRTGDKLLPRIASPIPPADQADAAQGSTWRKSYTFPAIESRCLDSSGAAPFNLQRSGAPVRLTGQKGNPVRFFRV
jgi:hypothetical protein